MNVKSFQLYLDSHIGLPEEEMLSLGLFSHFFVFTSLPQPHAAFSICVLAANWEIQEE